MRPPCHRYRCIVLLCICIAFFVHNGKFVVLSLAFLLCVFYTSLMRPNKVETGGRLLTCNILLYCTV